MLQTSCRLWDRKFSCDRYGVFMEVTQQQWNYARATARAVMRGGAVGIEDHEDLAQEAWISFLRTGKDPCFMPRKLKFLYATACRDLVRRGRNESLEDFDSSAGYWVRNEAREHEDMLEVLRGLGLSDVSLGVFEGLAHGLTRKQIAARLDITVATVGWIVKRWADHVAEGVRHVGRSGGDHSSVARSVGGER